MSIDCFLYCLTLSSSFDQAKHLKNKTKILIQFLKDVLNIDFLVFHFIFKILDKEKKM